MSIHLESEQLRKAIKWVSDEHCNHPGTSLLKLIEEASLRFNLAPKDEEFLVHVFTETGSEKSE